MVVPLTIGWKEPQDKGFNLMVVSKVCWDTLKLKIFLKTQDD